MAHKVEHPSRTIEGRPSFFLGGDKQTTWNLRGMSFACREEVSRKHRRPPCNPTAGTCFGDRALGILRRGTLFILVLSGLTPLFCIVLVAVRR